MEVCYQHSFNACGGYLSSHSSELVAVMKAMGNKKHHQIWEARKPRSKPTPASTRDEREAFIRAKYISKDFLFVLPPSSKDPAEVGSPLSCLEH